MDVEGGRGIFVDGSEDVVVGFRKVIYVFIKGGEVVGFLCRVLVFVWSCGENG